eukprot:jgi/Chlat1/7840/Chrsp66S07340
MAGRREGEEVVEQEDVGEEVEEESAALRRGRAALLYRRMRVGISDGRVLEGLFHCLDKQGNIILMDTAQVTPSGERRPLGQVLVPAAHRTSLHIETASAEEEMREENGSVWPSSRQVEQQKRLLELTLPPTCAAKPAWWLQARQAGMWARAPLQTWLLTYQGSAAVSYWRIPCISERGLLAHGLASTAYCHQTCIGAKTGIWRRFGAIASARCGMSQLRK